jgi:uncharacterized secreted protein with C-terminal beta-propeller domain
MDESDAGSDSAAAEIPASGDSDGGVSEVRPADLPEPQSDYDYIYAALDEVNRAMWSTDVVYDSVEVAGAVGDPTTNNESDAATDAVPAPAMEAPAPTDSVPPAEASEGAQAGAAPLEEKSEESAAAMPTEDSAETAGDSASPATADGAADAEIPAAGAPPEFSDTNIQTEGVQEADVVKTDGRYIYTANSESICITDAGAGHPDVVSEIPQVTDDGQVIFEMYINGDTLTLIRQGYNNIQTESGDATKEKLSRDGCIAYPGERYMIDTSVDIYDVSDRDAPRKVRSLSQSGGYIDSRMIGDKLYLISNYGEFDYAAMDKDDPRTYVPLYAEGEDQIISLPGEIYVPPRSEYMSYTVVSGIDTSKAKFVSRESLLGESFTVYASIGNLYLSAMKYGYGETDEFGYHITKNSDYTRVTRLSLKDGNVKVEASADVPGIVDDQFSLDESDGTLRVVTTHSENVAVTATAGGDGKSYSEEYYGEDNEPLNDESDNVKNAREIEKKYGKLEWEDSRYYDTGDYNAYRAYGYGASRSTGLYILDMNLSVLGKVDDLAPGEQVYSCRYIGDVAYFVTFRNTDPLFSVDLSDPSRPKVMDKLKIPGFSDYLHPYADGLLFGLGFDADENTGEVKSVKVSMFDNSDPFDVTEKDKLIIEEFYYTEAADNHKAILVDSRKGLIAFPAEGEYAIMKYDEGNGFSRVMDISLNSDGSGSWYSGLRGMFIDDVFYVIAPDSIHTYDMNEGFKPIDSVSLGSGARYVDRYSFELPPDYDYRDFYEDIPIEAFNE